MHILYLNPFVDRELSTPGEILRRYRSMRLWCESVAGAGHRVTVWQGFPQHARCEENGVGYEFLPYPSRPERLWPDRIRSLAPDVIHLDGLLAPVRTFRLLETGRRAGVPMVIQDHGGGRRPTAVWKTAAAIHRARPQALLFSAADLARPWFEAGIFGPQTEVLEVMESSTEFQAEDRERARRATGLDGEPLIVSVGRLTRGKDPVTTLRGFALFAAGHPGTRLAMIYRRPSLLARLRRIIERDRRLADRVSLLGEQPHEQIRLILSAADCFVSASLAEGSGYSALEAMACGAVPVLTDIPSFRVMTGNRAVGGLFAPGDARGMAGELERLMTEGLVRGSTAVREHFRRELSFEALGRHAAAAYRRVYDRFIERTRSS